MDDMMIQARMSAALGWDLIGRWLVLTVDGADLDRYCDIIRPSAVRIRIAASVLQD
jgi:hypothetical protein